MNDSPFALLDSILHAEVGGTTVGAIAINGMVVLGAAALVVGGVRWAFGKTLGTGK